MNAFRYFIFLRIITVNSTTLVSLVLFLFRTLFTNYLFFFKEFEFRIKMLNKTLFGLSAMRLILVALLLVISTTNAFNWQWGSNNQVKWASNCDFNGHDIGSQGSRAEDCGNLCVSNQQCTHFTHWNGVCYMKKANYPTARDSNGAVCGWVDNRSEKSFIYFIF